VLIVKAPAPEGAFDFDDVVDLPDKRISVCTKMKTFNNNKVPRSFVLLRERFVDKFFANEQVVVNSPTTQR
jgi:hypothetical protein